MSKRTMIPTLTLIALLSAVPVLDPDAPRRRVTFDSAAFDRDAPLKEIGPMHWAAV